MKTPTELEEQIEEAIKDGLSNHTGEWFNGFIAPGLKLEPQQSEDLLFYLIKAKRLNNNIQALLKSHQQKLLDRLDKYIGDAFMERVGVPDIDSCTHAREQERRNFRQAIETLRSEL